MALCCAWILSGCAAKFVDLTPTAPIPRPAGLPFDDSVGIESIRVDAGADAETKRWQGDLAGVLRKETIFQRVDDPCRSDDPTNLLLRAKVSGRFRGGGGYGFLNFLTWFPGPFLFTHNWRGTRFEYEARADVELIDAQTREVVGNYEAQKAYKLIHRSSNPGPMFGAMVIIPGVVKATVSTWPREKYRRMFYEKTYPELWELIAARMANDRAGYYEQRRTERRERCGHRLDADPVVGSTWTDFQACQTRSFTLAGQEPSEAGTVTVYVNAARSLKVHVIDGRIARWLVR